MRILLDNCVDHRFARLMPDVAMTHARELGWAQLSNGKLLDASEEAGFNVLLTVDRSVRKQQNLAARKITLITLEAKSILLEDLAEFVPEIRAALAKLESAAETESSDLFISIARK